MAENTRMHVVHVESRTHIWGKRPRSPVLRRVLLAPPGLGHDADTERRVMHARAFDPVLVDIGLGPWCDRAAAFVALGPLAVVMADESHHKDQNGETPRSTRPRRSFGRPMPTTACADHMKAKTSPPHTTGVKGSTAHASTAQEDMTRP